MVEITSCNTVSSRSFSTGQISICQIPAALQPKRTEPRPLLTSLPYHIRFLFNSLNFNPNLIPIHNPIPDPNSNHIPNPLPTGNWNSANWNLASWNLAKWKDPISSMAEGFLSEILCSVPLCTPALEKLSPKPSELKRDGLTRSVVSIWRKYMWLEGCRTPTKTRSPAVAEICDQRLKVKGLDIIYRHLHLTTSSGLQFDLTGNDTMWRSARSGSPLPKWTEFGPRSLQLQQIELCCKFWEWGVWGLKVGVGGWKLYHRNPRRALPNY